LFDPSVVILLFLKLYM